ncbi:MAG: hypothetical protein IT331_07330 [Anaerolineae bacterium]|nr:hypothetical protein [Anaerolineae bacterium]
MDILQFLRDLWSCITAALTLDTTALSTLLLASNARLLALCVALLAGVSKLAGDSIALFVNRVSPRRFVLALLGGAVTFALELLLWATSIWVIATLLFPFDKTLTAMWVLVAVASAPWVFGFLVFVPTFGALIRWVLRIWSWLIVLVLLRDASGLSLAASFVAATVGWLALRALGILFARRSGAFHARLWKRLTGVQAELTFEEQAQALAKRLRT